MKEREKEILTAFLAAARALSMSTMLQQISEKKTTLILAGLTVDLYDKDYF